MPMDKIPLLLIIFLLLIAFLLVPSVLAEDFNTPWDVDCYDLNPYNGFINDVGVCVPGILTKGAWLTKSPSRFWGTGDTYAPGLMEYVCDGRCNGYKDGVALMSCGDVGRTAWLKRPDKKWDGPFLVVDCSHKRHLWMNVNVGLVVEWGYKTTERWGQAVVPGIIVHLGSKPNDNSRGWYYRTWWIENAMEWEEIDIYPSALYIGYREIAIAP